MHKIHCFPTEFTLVGGDFCAHPFPGPADCSPAGSAILNDSPQTQGECDVTRNSSVAVSRTAHHLRDDQSLFDSRSVHRSRSRSRTPITGLFADAARRSKTAMRIPATTTHKKTHQSASVGGFESRRKEAKIALVRAKAPNNGDGPVESGSFSLSSLISFTNRSNPTRRAVSIARCRSMLCCPAVSQAISAHTVKATNNPHCDCGVPQVFSNTFGVPPVLLGNPTFSMSVRKIQSSRQSLAPISGQYLMPFPLSPSNLAKTVGGVYV